MDKLLTIVIPTYNMQAYLHRCLDSLLLPDKQMEQLEVLVVNDGSKDNSSAIAHEYETKYPNTFRVIDKENGNYGSCVNRGLKEATGKYIKILDADDWFDTENFKKYISFLTKTDADLVLSDFDYVYNDGSIQHHIHYGFDNQNVTLQDIATRKMVFLMHAVTYRTQNLRNINYHQTEGISYTDQEWIFLPMTTVKKIRYFGQVVYKYLIGREGQTMDPAVFYKNFSHEMKGTDTMMQQYENIASLVDKEHLEYLTWRLNTRIHLVYSAFLLKEGMTLGMESLNSFDAIMCERYPLSRNLANSMWISKRIPIRFIRSYRRFHSRNTPALLFYRMYIKFRKHQ